tara:strand:+ start:722 stop:910 length:189 start_codon:yes stop_codon:yes gene_type:complete
MPLRMLAVSMRAVATGSPPFAAESTTSGLIERCSTPTIRNGGGAEGELDDDIATCSSKNLEK